MKTLLISLLGWFVLGCQPNSTAKIEQWKSEIIAVEEAFNDMAQEEGIEKAFTFYAAEDGVLRRNHKIIQGKADISAWYNNDVRPGDSLSWTPTFVDISAAGDLAYTYGDFTFSYLDSLGQRKVNTGIFHTVWKRQKDGSWRYVWD